MKDDKTPETKQDPSVSRRKAKDLSLKLQELEIQKEKLEETIKAREEQLLNLFSYIQATKK